MRWGRLFPRDDTYPITLGIQMGVPGLAALLAVMLAAGALWFTTARAREPEPRALGLAGLAVWFALVFGSAFLPTLTMIVPQLYFWLLTGVAANLRATQKTEVPNGSVPRRSQKASALTSA